MKRTASGQASLFHGLVAADTTSTQLAGTYPAASFEGYDYPMTLAVHRFMGTDRVGRRSPEVRLAGFRPDR